MNLNELLTSIENIEHSTVIVYPKKKTLYGQNRIDCPLCSDENGRYYFQMHDHPEAEKIFNTDQIPKTMESVEFQLAFKIPTQEPTDVAPTA